jgi:hypothetical protein
LFKQRAPHLRVLLLGNAVANRREHTRAQFTAEPVSFFDSWPQQYSNLVNRRRRRGAVASFDSSSSDSSITASSDVAGSDGSSAETSYSDDDDDGDEQGRESSLSAERSGEDGGSKGTAERQSGGGAKARGPASSGGARGGKGHALPKGGQPVAAKLPPPPAAMRAATDLLAHSSLLARLFDQVTGLCVWVDGPRRTLPSGRGLQFAVFSVRTTPRIAGGYLTGAISHVALVALAPSASYNLKESL